MPHGSVRQRHAARVVARSTHSGFKPMIMGGQEVPSESAGAQGAVSRSGLPYEEARDGEQVQAPDIAPEAVDGGIHILANSITTDLLSADLVVSNVVNVGGTVIIDDTGIQIFAGALTFQDGFGSTVLTGAGFGGPWVDFLDSHVYNHRFFDGINTTYSAATEVSGGDSIQDYENSISPDLAYWVISDVSGASGTFKRVTNSSAPSGFALEWAGGKAGEVYQDIPISPGQVYSTYVTLTINVNGGDTVTSTIGCQFRDKEHGALGVVVEQSLLHTVDVPWSTIGMNWSATAPTTARYLRVLVAMGTAATSSVQVGAVNVDPINVFGPQHVVQGTTQYDNGFGIGWNDGSLVDIALVRSGTSKVLLSNPVGSGGDLDVEGDIRTGVGGSGQIISMSASGFIQMNELAGVPAAPSGSQARLFIDDNGAGKTRLRVRFGTGAVQQIAIEP